MRDIALTLIFFGALTYVFSRPYIGIYLWTWLSLMNPHRLTYGFAFTFPFAQIVALATLASMLVSKEPKRLPWTRETVVMLVFILWMLFTTVFAMYPELAWEQWNKVWKIMLMVYITLMLINTRQKLDWLLCVIVVSLGLYGVKGAIFTILTGGSFRVQGPLGSFISGNNEMGLALIMIIPLMRYLHLQATHVYIRHGLMAAMVLTGIAAIGTQSRGALVGMAVMGIFLAWKSRNRLFILLAVAVVAGSVVSIMPQEWHDRMASIKNYEEDDSAQGRLHAWATAFNVAKHRITGGGYEAFQPGLYYLYGRHDRKLSSTDAHSIYFEIMGEHGFIGFALFMLLAWFTWNTGSRIRRLARRTPETGWGYDMASMLQVSLMGYASGGAFLGLAYFDLYYTLIAVMVICSLLVREQVAAAQAVESAPVSGSGGPEIRGSPDIQGFNRTFR